MQPFVCLESDKLTNPDASKLINESEWAKPVPAAVSAHKSSLFLLLKQDKSMNLINGFDFLWKHTVEKAPYPHPFTDAVNIQILCIYSWMFTSIIVLDTVECLRQVAKQWLQQILVLWIPRSEEQQVSSCFLSSSRLLINKGISNDCCRKLQGKIEGVSLPIFHDWEFNYSMKKVPSRFFLPPWI